MNLAIKPSESTGAVPAGPTDSPKEYYPMFTLEGEQVDDFKEECGGSLDLGDTVIVTVKMRVSSMASDKYGQRVGFDMLTLDCGGGKESGEKHKRSYGDFSRGLMADMKE